MSNFNLSSLILQELIILNKEKYYAVQLLFKLGLALEIWYILLCAIIFFHLKQSCQIILYEKNLGTREIYK